jgi:hypothetical protein
MAETQAPAQVRKCGAAFKRKVKGGKEAEYHCEKPKGHEGAHGKVASAKPVNVPLTALDSFEAVPDTEYIPLVTHKRSDEQKRVDEHVRAAYEAWVGAGKPEKSADSPRKRYIVPVEHEDGVRTMLRRAGAHHNLRVQIAPAVRHESGGVSIQFRVTDKRQGEKPSEIRANS